VGGQTQADGVPLKTDKRLQHGVSLTDACISMEQTIPVLQQLADAVRQRRLKK
jgi:phospho-2-dehydro-3-deoxyheptonate aldolase